MATYTITKVTTRPNTSTEWPWEVHGPLAVNPGPNSASISYSDDDLIQTTVVVFNTQADFNQTRSDAFQAKIGEYGRYMAANNISGRITEEDGTVRVFNPSNKAFEVE